MRLWLLLWVLMSALADHWSSPAFLRLTGQPFSDGVQPLFGGQYYPIAGFSCSGIDCATKTVEGVTRGFVETSNVSLIMDVGTARYTDWGAFGTSTPSVTCGLGSIAASIACSGSNCASIQLQCMEPSFTDNLWRMTGSATTFVEVGPFGSGLQLCPAGSLLSGITCTSNGCAVMKLRCAYIELRVCDSGYTFNNNYACMGIPCSLQTNPPFGTITTTNFGSYPSVSTLACVGGYQVSGVAKRNCTTSGGWTGVAPTCVGIMCQSLPPVPNGDFVLASGYTYPTTATYSCNPGYTRSSPNPRKCFLDGSWTGSPVTCVGINCAALLTPPNCQLNISNGGVYPAVANMTGKMGYKTSGVANIHCLSTGTWSQPLGSCVGLPCPVLPPSPSYSIVVSNGGIYPADATISCKPGYNNDPVPVLRTCQPDLTWSGSMPPCPRMHCGTPYQPARCVNQSIVTDFYYQSRAYCTCIPGYTACGVLQDQYCGTLGQWENWVGCCAITCQVPQIVRFTTFTVSNPGVYYPAVLNYSCDDGYIKNSSGLTCEPDSTWLGWYPNCTGIECSNDVFWTPECNCGNFTSNNRIFPSVNFFWCLEGYIYKSGSTSRVCSTQGNWSNTNLVCVGIPCVQLTCSGVPCSVNYTNGRVYPSIATATCPEGYRTSTFPNVTSQCTVTGLWSPPLSCLGVPCDAVPNVSHGFRAITNNMLYPATVTTTCDIGYLPVGGPVINFCGTNGKWSDPFPKCLGVPCNTANFDTSVQTFNAPNNHTYPENVTTTCHSGYEINVSTFSCSTSGVYCCAPWKCTGKRCNNITSSVAYSFEFSPVQPTNVSYFPVDVTFTCTPGYFTINHTQGSCLPDRSWSIPPPRCVRYAIDELQIFGKPTSYFNTTNNITDETPKYVSTSSYFGGDLLEIIGEFPRVQPANITYGPLGISFLCTLVTWNSTYITCNTSMSYGKECTVVISWINTDVGDLVIDSNFQHVYVTHPKPTLTPLTIVFEDEETSGLVVNRPLKAKSTRGGDRIGFAGFNFSDFFDQVTITYGVSLSEQNNECTLDSVNDTYATCITSSGELGPHYFTLSVHDVHSDLGKDGYQYPIGPVVRSVVGCNTTNFTDHTEALDCPTAGRVTVTIIGSTFRDGPGLSAPTWMIGQTYGLATVYGNTSVTVTLPSGTGQASVIVATNDGQSAPRFMVTYAAPKFTLIGGCSCPDTSCGPGTGPYNCNRNGEQITIIGENFGAQGAQVFLVGGGPCVNVSHDSFVPHNKITCWLPPGFALHVPLAMVQLAGFLSFAEYPVDISYAQCQPGYFQDGTNTVCGSCDPGRFSSLVGQTVCNDCFYGEYSSSHNAKICMKAPEGSYVPTIRANHSILCAPGTFSSSAGALACKDCPPGSYAPSIGSLSCLPCSPGTVQATQGQTNCTHCATGSFAPNPGLLACLICPVGMIANATESTECVSCPAGTFSVNTSYCQACSPGSYMPLQGSSSCLQCDEGYISNHSNAVECLPCNVGSFQGSKQGSRCEKCIAGTFANAAASSVCLVCSKGTFALGSGLTGCTDCPEGKYGPLPSLAECLDCDAGRYSANPHSEVCTDCPAGTQQSSHNSTTCDDCLPGTYAQDTAWRTCNLCLPGTFAKDGRSLSCTSCPKGTFSNESSSTACYECPTGTYGPAEGQTFCVLCPPGQYMFATRAEVCLPCIVGKAVNTSGAIDCDYCSVGHFADATGLSECHECNPGYFARGVGQSVCEGCSMGTYRETSGGSVCDLCNPGTYSARSNALVCDPCPRGTFQMYHRGTVCAACEVGTSSDQPSYPSNTTVGATTCINCVPGFYAPLSAMYICSPCEAGKYANSYHSSTCTLCLEGSANPLPGQPTCTNCLPGNFAENKGSTICQQCAMGKYALVSRTSRCSLCQPGTFANSTGQSLCGDCDLGYFAAVFGTVNCEACQPGFFGAVPRLTACVKCLKGTYNPLEGQVECPGCIAGRYTAVSGVTDCNDCVPGKYAALTRAISCGDCPPGRFVSTPASPTCFPCTPGKYNGRPGSGDCVLCQLGTASSQPGAAVCDECKAGYYAPILGASTCVDCDAGTYQKRMGASICEVCDAGTFSDQGQEECEVCPVGFANPFPHAKQCRQCDFNGFSASPPKDCICEVGYFAPTRIPEQLTPLECIKCPRGIECKKIGVTFENMEVSYGWWRESTNTTNMFKCILPSHCLGGHESTCGQNRHDKVCSLCMPGYAASGSGRTGVCELCKGRSNSMVEVVFLFLALAAGLGFLYYLVLRTEKTNTRKMKAEGEWWVDDGKVAYAVGGRDSSLSASSMNTGDSSDEVRKPTKPVSAPQIGPAAALPAGMTPDEARKALQLDYQSQQEDRIKERRQRLKDAATLTGKIRIIVSLLQIGTTIVSTMDIPWPALFKSFLELLNFVNLDFVPWQSVGCVAHVSYFDKLYMITAIPIAAFICLTLLYLVPTAVWHRRQMSDHDVYELKRSVARAKFWRLCLFTVFLVYPYVSSSIFRMYICYNLEGVYYMKMDFEVLCFSDAWMGMVGPSVAMIIIYPFGIPFVTFCLLWRYRRVLVDTEQRVRLGFLYESYVSSCWYFEMILMINKLFLVSFVQFFPDRQQMPAAMIWLCCYLTVVLLLRPYLRKSDDRLELFAGSLLILLCMCGHVLTVEPALDVSTDYIMSLVLIGLFLFVFLFFNLIAIRLLVRKARRFLVARASKARALQRAASRSDSVALDPPGVVATAG